ncbi:MAG TPA: hypothetical protein VHJ17_20000 [Thermomonospora sp.]|nr:hypothetical protein [Thermomonospora sp.]
MTSPEERLSAVERQLDPAAPDGVASWVAELRRRLDPVEPVVRQLRQTVTRLETETAAMRADLEERIKPLEAGLTAANLKGTGFNLDPSLVKIDPAALKIDEQGISVPGRQITWSQIGGWFLGRRGTADGQAARGRATGPADASAARLRASLDNVNRALSARITGVRTLAGRAHADIRRAHQRITRLEAARRATGPAGGRPGGRPAPVAEAARTTRALNELIGVLRNTHPEAARFRRQLTEIERSLQ